MMPSAPPPAPPTFQRLPDQPLTLPSPLPPTLRRWQPPPSAGLRILLPAVVVAALVAVLLPGAPRPGINVPLSGLVLAAPLLVLLRQQRRRRRLRRPIGYAAGTLVTVAAALTVVSAVRATTWLSVACALAGLCLLLAVLLDLRRWDAVLAGPGMFAVAVARSLAWVGRDLQRTPGPAVPKPVLTGAVIGAGLVLAVGGLLASADQAYAQVLSLLLPPLDRLPLRVTAFLVTGLIFLGGAYAACSRRQWRSLAAGQERAAAEWLIPLVLVAITIATFLAVEAGTLFGGLDVVLRSDSALTHAARARQGFGQLCAVTLLVLALLAWAGTVAARGPAAGSGHRRLLSSAGGTLLALTLLLAGSALRRLALYQEAYGWTVARVNAGAFESWLVLVLLAAAGAWLVRRADLLPRLVIGSAGLGLLVVALLGPDALVARADVARFKQTGKIDIEYLSYLSDDAVPALEQLREPQRSCVLAGRTGADDPWLGWNLSRARAARLLAERPVPGTYWSTDCQTR